MNVSRRSLRNLSVLYLMSASVLECGTVHSLFLCECGPFLQICACTEARIIHARQDHGFDSACLGFFVYLLYLRSQRIEQLSGNCIACFGPVQCQNADQATTWYAIVLDSYDAWWSN